ncbi:MAG TPA: hypothetical protein VMU15_09920 [Anaeromyxobacter sp.]|nr:hypothetical protein [Anaeromyxobacter sp.]
MTARWLAGLLCALAVVGCGGGGGGGGKSKSCADVFTTPVSYTGQEVVAGCYNPGTYDITATVSQTSGTCDMVFTWGAVGGSTHDCEAKLSGDATNGYDVDSNSGGCSAYINSASIHLPPNLSTFTGTFDWTVTCGSGTTTFENIAQE